MLWRQFSCNMPYAIYGSEFHRAGTQNAKHCSPNIFVRILRTFNARESDDDLMFLEGIDGLRRLLRYTGDSPEKQL